MSKPDFKLSEGLFYDIPSKTYHAIEGTYSSSQLKDMDSPEYFFKKYISKEIQKDHMAAFDIGTYFHTGILEPEKIDEECAVFDGIRRGSKWDSFLAANSHKTIITKNEHAVAEDLIRSVKESPIAMGRISKGKPEVSVFVNLLISGGKIYHPSSSKILSRSGWEDSSKIPKDGVKLWLKSRSDSLGEDFILDLKSTTGDAKDAKYVRKVCFDLGYDLSAALYVDLFTAIKGNKHSFIWTFASKEYKNSRSYVASEDVIQIGRKKWSQAVIALAYNTKNNWVFKDYLEVLTAPAWEREVLNEDPEDLL